MRRHILTLLTGLASCYVALGQETECTAEENGRYYDLRSLNSKSDYLYMSESRREFRLNVCGPLTTEPWKLPDPKSIGAVYRGKDSDVSIGVINSTVLIKDSHPLLIFSNGAPCGGESSPLRASTAIRFICDNDVFGQGQPQLVAQLPPDDSLACAFFFEWRTHVACPSARPSTVGRFFAIISAVALIALLSYIVVGVTYRRFALGYRGLDQMPRIHIIPLSALPRSLEDTLDWFRDIRDHLRGGARDLWPRSNLNTSGPASNWNRRRDGFSPLAREEEQAMFRDGPDGPDARFSLEDEDLNGAQELTVSSPPVPRKDATNGIIFHDGPDAPDARFSLEDEDVHGVQELTVSSPPVPQKDTTDGIIRL